MNFENYCQAFGTGLEMTGRKPDKSRWIEIVRQIAQHVEPAHRLLISKIAGFCFGKGDQFGVKHLSEGQHGIFSPFWVEIKRPEQWFYLGVIFEIICQTLQEEARHGQ